MASSRQLGTALALGALVVGAAVPAAAEPIKCQKTIVQQLAKLKKQVLKRTEKCIDKQNLGKITGPCPDTDAQLKIQTTQDKVVARIALNCPEPDRTTLGFSTSCAFEAASSGVEATCAGMPPISSPSELATCSGLLEEGRAVRVHRHAVRVPRRRGVRWQPRRDLTALLRPRLYHAASRSARSGGHGRERLPEVDRQGRREAPAEGREDPGEVRPRRRDARELPRRPQGAGEHREIGAEAPGRHPQPVREPRPGAERALLLSLRDGERVRRGRHPRGLRNPRWRRPEQQDVRHGPHLRPAPGHAAASPGGPTARRATPVPAHRSRRSTI